MTALRSVWVAAGLAAALASLGDASLARAGSPGDLPPGWAGDEACAQCHAEKQSALPIHGALVGAKCGLRVQCETCHGPGAAHAEDPGVGPMSNPETALAVESNRACLECHGLPLEVDGLQHQHARASLRCSECHSVHGTGTERALLCESPTEKCTSCHGSVASELRHVSHHPILDGQLDCATCHIPAIEATGVRAPRGANSQCVTCHAEHDVLAPYEHPAGSEVALEGEGCTVCHAPHGSPHARLLRRSGNDLCLQCHTVPGQHATAHSGIYAGMSCQECHVDVHGSYTNRLLLAPHPLGQDCLTCHGQ